ncbi:BnaCnng37510D, partial [Brassica napus]
MVEVVGSCRRMEVVEICTLLLVKESSMVEVVGSCRRMEVVEICTLLLVKESSMGLVFYIVVEEMVVPSNMGNSFWGDMVIWFYGLGDISVLLGEIHK